MSTNTKKTICVSQIAGSLPTGREIDLWVGEENNQFTNHVDVSGKEVHLLDPKPS